MGRRAVSQAATTTSRRSRGAFGIVTSTVSGRARSSTRSISSGPAEHGHALEPAAAEARVVVDEADHRLARASRAARAAGCVRRGPAPTIRVRRRSPRSRSEWRPRTTARSPKRDSADQHRAEQRVDDEDGAREVARRARQREEDEGDASETTTAVSTESGIARAGVAPDAAVEPEEDEGDVARGEHDGRDHEVAGAAGRPSRCRRRGAGRRRRRRRRSARSRRASRPGGAGGRRSAPDRRPAVSASRGRARRRRGSSRTGRAARTSRARRRP